ncbi:hypothetical protein [Lewinella sp. LCG006]|uniref:hypothetical protein n=1 Tax=Lewinella sp. LCG006 TaxID=3231911 RepID=UPI0034612A6D
MKNTLLFVTVVILSLSACLSSAFNKRVQRTTIQPYSGPNSFQVSLLDKIDVEFDTSYSITDKREQIKNRVIPLLLYNEWESDFLHHLYLNEEKTTIANNLREQLLGTLSNSTIHRNIDSLRVYITELELITVYHNKGYLVTIPLLFGMSNHYEIGPSRVSLEVAYACFHDGHVTENVKLFKRTISADQSRGLQGGRNYIIQVHLERAYGLVNELLGEASETIKRELEEEL